LSARLNIQRICDIIETKKRFVFRNEYLTEEHSMWYEKCYRRNLVDMHIEDWDKRFLAQFDPEEYVANLKRGHIQAAMLYFQSHVGHCYFPTKTGHMHAAFRGREDLMRRVVDLCRREGIYVVGYYSLIYNTYEEDRHPEWRVIGRDSGNSRREGGGRYGLCCPNNPEYVSFVKEQIREMAEYFTVDGMFYDMTFWPEICDCPHCRARYLKESGREELPGGKVPACDWKNEEWLAFQQMRIRWMGEFAHLVTEETRRLMPGVSVEHNCANAIAAHAISCNTELVINACDYAGGDLYGDLYNHSFAAKYYYAVTRHQPFEYMTVRCDRSLRAHGNSKTEEHLALEVLLTAAHHGASFIIDAIDPVGTLDSRAYELIGRVFEREMPYEKYFSGALIEDVGIYFSTTGKFNSRGQKFDSKTACAAMLRALVEENVPIGVIANTTTNNLTKYKAVLAPQLAGISERNRLDLKAYAEAGGILYISGAEDTRLLELLLNAKIVGYTEGASAYLAPQGEGIQYFGQFNEKYPLPIEASLPIAEIPDAQVLASLTLPYTKPGEKRFASIHSNPPGISTGIPALVKKKLGRGVVIWSAAPLEMDERRSHRRILHALLNAHLDYSALTVRSNAPRQVEIVSFRRESDMLISAADLQCTDELIPVRPFVIEARSDKPKRVIRIGGKDREDEDVPFTYDGERVSFRAEALVMFDMYKIEY